MLFTISVCILGRSRTVLNIFSLAELLFSLFQTPSPSLQPSCSFKGNETSIISLTWRQSFMLSSSSLCLQSNVALGLSHNYLCWDCRLYSVWTAEGNTLHFYPKAVFHLQQQLEAKTNFCLGHLCCCGAGLMCDAPSER